MLAKKIVGKNILFLCLKMIIVWINLKNVLLKVNIKGNIEYENFTYIETKPFFQFSKTN